MSNRRAAYRRDMKKREKILKSKAPGSDLLRARNEGWEEGKLIALCVAVESLHEEFGWRKEKIHNFTESLAKNSANSNADVIRVAAKPWQSKLLNRITEASPQKARMIVSNPKEKLKYDERNHTYIACASIVMLALFSEYNFSSNSKRTGRMDKIIERYTVRFFNMMEDAEYYSGTKYAIRVKNLTGMDVA